MTTKIEVIYKGGMTPELSIDKNPESRTYGWLMAKHPDGQWVTLANLKPQLAAAVAAERERCAKLLEATDLSYWLSH